MTSAAELVERLRAEAQDGGPYHLCHDAADMIEMLAAAPPRELQQRAKQTASELREASKSVTPRWIVHRMYAAIEVLEAISESDATLGAQESAAEPSEVAGPLASNMAGHDAPERVKDAALVPPAADPTPTEALVAEINKRIAVNRAAWPGRDDDYDTELLQRARDSLAEQAEIIAAPQGYITISRRVHDARLKHIAAQEDAIYVREGKLLEWASECDALEAELAEARKVLLSLDQRGGLGFDRHEQIKQALKVPYPKFCIHADKCMGQSSCPRDPCCCD